jgi:membrane-bound lytic murein transglycosylase MltF
VPYGYARGWEPVLYVNNIRAYYTILQWLTEKEENPVIEEIELATGAKEIL